MATKQEQQKNKVERMCAVCRRHFPQKELMRFAADAKGIYHIDLTGRAQGRGKYLCYDYACMESLIKSPKHRPFPVDKESLAVLEGLHAERKVQDSKENGHERKRQQLLQLLGLAYKAKQVSLGFELTAEALARDELKLLVLAKDISDNSLGKMRKAILAAKVPTVTVINSRELGLALGKQKLAIVGIKDSGLAEKFQQILLSQLAD